MHKPSLPTLQTAFSLVIVILLHSGCATTPIATPPPIIDDNKPVVGSGDSRVPDTGSTTGTTTHTTGCNCGSTYTVKPKDTLYGIATQCCLEYKDLARWNQLPSTYEIRPGQTLTLSGPADTTTLSPTPVYDSNSPTTEGSDAEGVYHTVAPQENLFRIAKRYKRTVEQIKQWNGMQSNSLTVGQRLRVSPPAGKGSSEVTPQTPASSSTVVSTSKTLATPTRNKNSSGRYVVNPGDTLYSVAKLYGYTEADIAAWNDLQPPYSLAEGQILVVSPPSSIPPSPSSASRKTAVVEEGKTGYHTVVPGDTLFNVSKHYGCTVSELKAWNDLSANELSVGQQLRVTATNAGNDKTTTSLSPPSINYVKHKVRQGETLYRVATQYGMKEEELAHLNGIGPPYTVFPGQELTVLPKK